MVLLLATACGGETVEPMQVGELGVEEAAALPQTETPAPPPQTEAQDTPPPTEVIPVPESLEEPEEQLTQESPSADETALDRRRHQEIRTTGNIGGGHGRATPSGIHLTGRGFGSMSDEEKQTVTRELAEDATYQFFEQLMGPYGYPVAIFNYHTYAARAAGNNTRDLGWITLDIIATGESFLVTEADMNAPAGRNRAPRVQLQAMGGQWRTSFTLDEFDAFIREHAGL